MPPRCGRCHRCEQACPTGALARGRCDARRCLSYWTIEAKGEPPPEIRQAQGERLYGCDSCQEVCPWNRLPAPRRVDARLLMPAKVAEVAAVALAELPERAFDSFFARSPIRRIGVQHMRSNVEGLS